MPWLNYFLKRKYQQITIGHHGFHGLNPTNIAYTQLLLLNTNGLYCIRTAKMTLSNLVFCFDFLVVLWFGPTASQGLPHTRQTLPRSYISSPLWEKVLLSYSRLVSNLWPSCSASQLAEIIGMCHYAWPISALLL